MIGDWRVRHYPRCTHHVFLSHCAENRRTLVHPVYTGLQKDQYLPWLDRHHYPRGQGAFAALREAIIRCRHVVYFVTEEFYRRGEDGIVSKPPIRSFYRQILCNPPWFCAMSNYPYSFYLEVMRPSRDRRGDLSFNLDGSIPREKWTVAR